MYRIILELPLGVTLVHRVYFDKREEAEECLQRVYAGYAHAMQIIDAVEEVPGRLVFMPEK